MSYDQQLAERVRRILAKQNGLVEKKMFGGICFLLDGHMCCGVMKRQLVVRVGPDDYDRMVATANAHPMDFNGKPLRGFIYVLPRGLDTRRAIEGWVGHGVRYAKSLPKKRRNKKYKTNAQR